MAEMRTIVYPTDFSSCTEHAFPIACALARDRGAGLLILHVYPPPICHGEVVARRQPNGYPDELWTILSRLRPSDPAVRVGHFLREGEPATEILALAQECHAEMIVMSTHGRTGLGRLLMGSVAEQVVRRAPCPVLTVSAARAASGIEPVTAGTESGRRDP